MIHGTITYKDESKGSFSFKKLDTLFKMIVSEKPEHISVTFEV